MLKRRQLLKSAALIALSFAVVGGSTTAFADDRSASPEGSWLYTVTIPGLYVSRDRDLRGRWRVPKLINCPSAHSRSPAPDTALGRAWEGACLFLPISISLSTVS